MHDTDDVQDIDTHNVIRRDILLFSSGRFFVCVSHSVLQCASFTGIIPVFGFILIVLDWDWEVVYESGMGSGFDCLLWYV